MSDDSDRIEGEISRILGEYGFPPGECGTTYSDPDECYFPFPCVQCGSAIIFARKILFAEDSISAEIWRV